MDKEHPELRGLSHTLLKQTSEVRSLLDSQARSIAASLHSGNALIAALQVWQDTVLPNGTNVLDHGLKAATTRLANGIDECDSLLPEHDGKDSCREDLLEAIDVLVVGCRDQWLPKRMNVH